MPEFLEINGVTIEVPAEIVAEGRDAVQRFYDERAKSQSAAPRPARPVAAAAAPTSTSSSE